MSANNVTGPKWKKVKIDKTPRTTAKNDDITTPKQALESYIVSKFASLLPAAKTLAEHLTREFVKLRTKKRQQDAIIVKLEKGDFVPTSARIDVPLHAMARVKESAAHKALVDEMNNNVKAF